MLICESHVKNQWIDMHLQLLEVYQLNYKDAYSKLSPLLDQVKMIKDITNIYICNTTKV